MSLADLTAEAVRQPAASRLLSNAVMLVVVTLAAGAGLTGWWPPGWVSGRR